MNFGLDWLKCGTFFEKSHAKIKTIIKLEQSLVTKTLVNKINITIYFKNPTIELYVIYVLNTHVKFCVNQILFTI